jgi:hypothetical protein
MPATARTPTATAARKFVRTIGNGIGDGHFECQAKSPWFEKRLGIISIPLATPTFCCSNGVRATVLRIVGSL